MAAQIVDLPTPIPKSVVVTKAFAPKFCAEWSDQEIQSSHKDYFGDHFCVYVSGPKSWPRSQKSCCREKVCTEILCEKVCIEIHSSHYIYYHFCVYVSGLLLTNFQRVL